MTADDPMSDPLAVVPPLHLSTTFTRAADGSYPQGYFYTRTGNPNRHELETAVADLEGGAVAFAFSSGMAATTSVLQTLKAGDHVLIPEEAYHGTKAVVREIFSRWDLKADLVDMTNLESVRRALQPKTRLIWVESPSNPCLRLTDIAATAAVARQAGALCVADNTLATPLGQSPLALGCDLVMHSTTKYLNGHSDVLGGVVVAREHGEVAERLKAVQSLGGAVPAPFDCWLTRRGMRTLAVRLAAQVANAQILAERLSTHSCVSVVHYPGLPGHPQFELARRQMRSAGGLLAFEVRGSNATAQAVAAAVRGIQRATSLGGFETLIEHRASMEGPSTKTPVNLLRLAVGIEPVEQLWADLDQALLSAK